MSSMSEIEIPIQASVSRAGNDHGARSRPPLVVGISGASGAIYGVRLLEVLAGLAVPTHLVVTEWGDKTLRIETQRTPAQVRTLADWWHSIDNQAAPIASGSHLTIGMAIVPCSVNTLAALAHGRADNLLLRAADVTLKERRPLVAVVRETPLSRTHIRNMMACTEAGITIMPPVPGFYAAPQDWDAHVDQFTGRVLDQFGIDHELGGRWRSPGNHVQSMGVPADDSKRSSDPS